MCERGLPQQASDSVGLRFSERADVVDDLDKVAACRPFAGIIREGLLVLDRAVDVDSKASFRLCTQVGLERRPRAGDQPLELSSLCGAEAHR